MSIKDEALNLLTNGGKGFWSIVVLAFFLGMVAGYIAG